MDTRSDITDGIRPFLTVSIVVYRSDPAVLAVTFESLNSALKGIGRNDIEIFVIQNCTADNIAEIAEKTLRDFSYSVVKGHGNIGFGRAHNLVLSRTGEFHLVLNPDIEMEQDAIANSLEFMDVHKTCGLLTPNACWPDGTRQYLCKRYPALFDLLLRGFAPQTVKNYFSERLARYEMSNETGTDVFWNPPIVSGCFMFFRGELFHQLGGFDPRYFLYFEDFDLALRASKTTGTAYVPNVRIVHEGGRAAHKGIKHIRLFATSAYQFYKVHGLRLF